MSGCENVCTGSDEAQRLDDRNNTSSSLLTNMGPGVQEVSVITARPTKCDDEPAQRKSVIASRSSLNSGHLPSENSVIVAASTNPISQFGQADVEQTEAKDYSKLHLSIAQDNYEDEEMDYDNATSTMDEEVSKGLNDQIENLPKSEEDFQLSSTENTSKQNENRGDNLDFHHKVIEPPTEMENEPPTEMENFAKDKDDLGELLASDKLSNDKVHQKVSEDIGDLTNSTEETKIEMKIGPASDNEEEENRKEDLDNFNTQSQTFSSKEVALKKESGNDSETETADIIELSWNEKTKDVVKKDPEINLDDRDDSDEPVEVKLEPEYDEYLENTSKPQESSQKKRSNDNRTGEFPCIECEYVAKRKDKLNLHFKIHHLGFKHKCDECGLQFARTDKLKKHRSMKHGITKMYTCDTCTFNSHSYKEYHTHIKQHPAKMFKCNYCSYFSPRQIRLKDHIERKHENGAYPCDVCGFIAISSRTLTRHKESKHSEFEYPCEMCDYKGRRPDHLVAHQKRVHKVNVNSEHVRKNNCINSDGHKVEIESKCAVQPQVLKTEVVETPVKQPVNDVKSELKEESLVKLKTELEDYDEDMGLDQVGETIFSEMTNDEELAKINPIEWLMLQGALTYEVKKEYDDDKETKFNPMDFISTEINRDEEFHEGEDHNDPSYNPKRKSTDAKSPGSLGVKIKGKIKSDPGAKPKEPGKKKKYKSKATGPFLCPVEGCDYATPRRDKLNLHNKTKHLGIRFPCDICGFQAMRRDKLKMHKERKHFNPQPRKKRVPKYEEGQIHYCDKCDYKSDKIKNLQAHSERVHSESTYPCDQCDFVATYKLNLKLHVDRMHSTKILMCDKCSYTTKDPVRLKYHNEGKHEDTKHPCDLCDYVGSLRCELMRHFRRKHRAETYKCDQCDYVGRRPDHLRDHKRRIHETVHESGGVKTPKKRRMKEKPAPPVLAPAMLPPTGLNDFYPQAVIRPNPSQSVVRPTPPQAHSSHPLHQPHHPPQNHLHLVDEKPTPRELSVYASAVQNLSGYAASSAYALQSPTHSDQM